MKTIPLTQGKMVLVDDDDYETLMQFKWVYKKPGHRRTAYAVRGKIVGYEAGKKYTTIAMHRVIMRSPIGYEIDHINGNGLDNRKENLRIATRAQNQQNRNILRHNTSGYKGVSKDRETWRAQIRVNNTIMRLGRFRDKISAAIAYNEAAKKYHGEFARLNPL